ncbi:acyltransferase [Pantoea sp. X85]|uniref:acyltransferase family protein n=1 Tax=Pantoea sp. X85 TaxID=3037258 RepID=UPI002413B52D|nr:acyltransferase [Pantoea sp. X85]WFL66362.1 acyltransferase [Pantoea sp. X85]
MVTSSGKNTDIEALRSIAIIFVMIAHSRKLLPDYVPGVGFMGMLQDYFGWWTGVDLFFCISGFIITSNLLKYKIEKKDAAGFVSFALPFWVKRMFRLWPAAWFWLTFVTVASIFLNKSGIFADPIRNLMYQVYAMLNVANAYGNVCFNTFQVTGGDRICGSNLVYWSLALEEQFYLIFPFIFFFLGKKKTLITVLLIAAIQIPLNRGGSWLGFIRTDAISLGVALAIFSSSVLYEKFNPAFLRNRAFAFATFWLFTAFLALLGSSKTVPVGFSTGLIAIVSAIMVWMASFNHDYFTGSRLTKSISMWIGARAYSLYLAHIPSYFLIVELAHRYNIHHDNYFANKGYIMLPVGIATAVFMAEMTHRFIEEPMRRIGREKAKFI